MKKLLVTFFILLVILPQTAFSVISVYQFDDPAKEARFNQLVNELRCPKCQNNNLADSNSELSIDLKDIIYEKVQAGESDEQILVYLKDRYGDFISYNPPVKPSTWLLWYGPFVFLLIGGFFLYRFQSSHRQDTQDQQNDEQQANSMLEQWAKEAKDQETK
ncbi:MAG: cytochrome c-type biogenesis protein CcmH [Gammaproteobacteria bacterium]|nr:cytochrome c-type biogenesis protein CcmH [Gammaproteobacteria bacterium]MDH5630423.1 cytochrome c-type biogenesis protein CcmH [Gammaproteobacteria bacterium]